MLYTLVVVLLLLWLLGFFVMNVGALVHALLAIALVVLVYTLATTRRGG